MTTTFLLNNNATSTLLDAVGTTGNLVVIQVADAGKFPVITGSEYFMLTLENASVNPIQREIVTCTATNSNTFTVVRAQEGFSAGSFPAGATVSNRITADTILALYEATGQAVQYYLGAQASDPSTTPSGGPLVVGMLYYNTTSSVLKEFNGTAWVEISGGSSPTSGSLYLGEFASPPTERPDGSALQEGDLYYDVNLIGLYEYHDAAWKSAGSTTITGTTTFVGNVIASENWSVTGTTNLVGPTNATTLSVGGNASVGDTLSIGTSESNSGTIFINGLPVVTAANLSGTHNSQNWPDGSIEYWGQSETGSGGTATIEIPGEGFPNSITYVDAQVISAGAGTPAANTSVCYNISTASFNVATFANGGGLNGPVAFYWRARGY